MARQGLDWDHQIYFKDGDFSNVGCNWLCYRLAHQLLWLKLPLSAFPLVGNFLMVLDGIASS